MPNVDFGFCSQPLHEGFLGDLGGNKVKVNWYSQETNLHRVSVFLSIILMLTHYLFHVCLES